VASSSASDSFPGVALSGDQPQEINLQNLGDGREFEIENSPIATFDFRDCDPIERQAFRRKAA